MEQCVISIRCNYVMILKIWKRYIKIRGTYRCSTADSLSEIIFSMGSPWLQQKFFFEYANVHRQKNSEPQEKNQGKRVVRDLIKYIKGSKRNVTMDFITFFYNILEIIIIKIQSINQSITKILYSAFYDANKSAHPWTSWISTPSDHVGRPWVT